MREPEHGMPPDRGIHSHSPLPDAEAKAHFPRFRHPPGPQTRPPAKGDFEADLRAPGSVRSLFKIHEHDHALERPERDSRGKPRRPEQIARPTGARAHPRDQDTEREPFVHTLQHVCRISADRVYLRRDLDARSLSPGRAFPAARFSAGLLDPRR